MWVSKGEGFGLAGFKGKIKQKCRIDSPGLRTTIIATVLSLHSLFLPPLVNIPAAVELL